MARRVKTVTAKGGSTPADRRVLVDITAPTAIPTLATDDFVLQQNEYVHVLFSVSGTAPVFRVRLYWFFEESGVWHKGNQVVVSGNDCMLVEAQGAARLHLVVESVAGTAPVLQAWLALARPV